MTVFMTESQTVETLYNFFMQNIIYRAILAEMLPYHCSQWLMVDSLKHNTCSFNDYSTAFLAKDRW